MTKREAEASFKENILPLVRKEYEQDGIRDIPARSEAWCNFTDMLFKDKLITRKQSDTWRQPRCCRRNR